ncbi:MAG: hypothetical protein MW689_000677 [Thermodesulfobacteria bacterium]|nr:hypothetical protein [Thermodesulfobacteriota bacterium]
MLKIIKNIIPFIFQIFSIKDLNSSIKCISNKQSPKIPVSFNDLKKFSKCSFESKSLSSPKKIEILSSFGSKKTKR